MKLTRQEIRPSLLGLGHEDGPMEAPETPQADVDENMEKVATSSDDEGPDILGRIKEVRGTRFILNNSLCVKHSNLANISLTFWRNQRIGRQEDHQTKEYEDRTKTNQKHCALLFYPLKTPLSMPSRRMKPCQLHRTKPL